MIFRATSIESFIMNGSVIFDRTVVFPNGTRVTYAVEDLFNEKFFIIPSTAASFTATEVYDNYYVHKWLHLIYTTLEKKYRRTALWKKLSIELMELIETNFKRIRGTNICETVMDFNGGIHYVNVKLMESSDFHLTMESEFDYIGDMTKVKLHTTSSFASSDSAVTQMAFDQADDPETFIREMQRHGMLKTALHIPLPKLLKEVRLLKDDVEFMAMPYARFNARHLKPIIDKVILNKRILDEVKLVINSPDLILESRSSGKGRKEAV